MTMIVSQTARTSLRKSIHSVVLEGGETPPSFNYTERSKLKIEVRQGNLEKAMRVLKKKLLKEGTFKLLKQKQYYEKPSEIKRRKMKEGIAKRKKRERERARILGI